MCVCVNEYMYIPCIKHSNTSFSFLFFLIAAASTDVHPQTWKSYIDIEKIENEFVLTSAEYLLSLAHVKWTNTGKLFFLLIRLYTFTSS